MTMTVSGEGSSAPVATPADDDNADKIRGRIPKFAWGYVRGQYEIAKRTYEDIGNEFNCTPSAVFYVVKQARDRDIPATLDAPDATKLEAQRTAQRARAALDRVVANANREFAQKHADIKPAPAPQPDPLSQLDNFPLTKRYLTAAGEAGKLLMAWETDRSEANWLAMEEKMKEVRKADAAVQIARYQKPATPPAAPSAVAAPVLVAAPSAAPVQPEETVESDLILDKAV